MRRGARLSDRLVLARETNFAGDAADCHLREFRDQHDVCRRIADGTGYHADHVGGIRLASSEAPNHCHHILRGYWIGGADLGGVAPSCAGGPPRLSVNMKSTRTKVGRHRSDCGWSFGRNRFGSLPRRRSLDTVPDRREDFSSEPRGGVDSRCSPASICDLRAVNTFSNVYQCCCASCPTLLSSV